VKDTIQENEKLSQEGGTKGFQKTEEQFKAEE